MLGALRTTTACVLLVPAIASADDPPLRDHVETAPTEDSPDVRRPWLYNDDPTIPSPMHVVASLGDTFSGNDRSVSRAFASAADGPGAKLSANAQVGLARMLALDVTGVVGLWGPAGAGPTSLHGGVGGGVMAGLELAPFAGKKLPFRLAIAGGYLMDLDQTSGVYARVMASYDVGRLRLAAMVHGEHVFRQGSDGIDLFATAGASVRVVPVLRVGLEYIVQDIEEAFASGGAVDAAPMPGRSEGGVHQFAGLTGSLELLQNRLFVNVGPALAFRPEIGQVAPVGRAVVSYSF